MIKNYLKIALRNILRNKTFSIINISGLAIGIATCLVISLWVLQEISYDDFHKNSDRIYRIERELFRDQFYSRWPITSGRYKQALIDDIPEIENAVRFWNRVFTIKDYDNNIHMQQAFATDNSVFQIFDFNLSDGDKSTALVEPNCIVLTKNKAQVYFGTSDVIGETLTLDLDGAATEFKITGILKEFPENSHIKFNMLISISTYPEERFDNWRANYLYTYILLKPNASIEGVENKLFTFVEQHLEPYYGDLLVDNYSIHKVLRMYLFPIHQIHLEPSINWELEAGGNISSVYLFSSIAILILFIAGINFTNLSTARARKRAKEVSLRKTIGASLAQLRVQFLQESILLSFFALLVSIIILMILIPTYNSLFNQSFKLSFLFQLQIIAILIGITFFIGLFAGLYPAIYLSWFEPAKILRGGLSSGKVKSSFQRNMIIVQFCISISLMIGMLIVYDQMEYIQNKSIGFEKENTLIIPARSARVSPGFNSFRTKLLSEKNILSVSSSGDLPGDEVYSNGGVFNTEVSDENINMIFMTCGYDFIESYRMKIISGRSFSRSFVSDTSGALVLNEAALKRIGWSPSEAVGKKLSYGNPVVESEVIGVVKDFNFRSMRQEIEPMMFMLAPDYISSISIRISPNEVQNAINIIERIWKSTFPNQQFEFGFMDERINQLYANERNMKRLLIVFSSLSILIACLGLFGLTILTVEEKTKEIGIRKTLGASIPTLLALLTKQYFKWVVVSTIIAWPIAYYLTNNWLEKFAYHIKLNWTPFLIAAVISLVIAFMPVSFQVIKAALANPVDCLRNE